MRLSKRLESAVGFAAFCLRYGVAPRDAAELITLAKRAAAAGERHHCGIPGAGDQEQRAGERFEKRAAELGFQTTWPGLWPVLQRDGWDVWLPTL